MKPRLIFSRLLARVAASEAVIIVHHGKPIARIVPMERKATKRIFGQDIGRVVIADDFDAPLKPETMR